MTPLPPDSSIAIILLSRGAAYANGATELTVLAGHLHAALAAQGRPPLRVQPAFVDRSQPTLPEALELCAQAQTIVILPVMVPDEPSLRRWLHKLTMRWRAQRTDSGPCPRLIFAGPLLQTPQLAGVLARTVEEALTRPGVQDVPAVVGDDAWEHDPAGWSVVPEHRQHLLWCVGPRCTAKGAVQLWPHLARMVRESPALNKQVMLLQTSCQFPCNHGPLMIATPPGVWFGHLDAAAIGQVIAAQLDPSLTDPRHVVHWPGKPEAALPPATAQRAADSQEKAL